MIGRTPKLVADVRYLQEHTVYMGEMEETNMETVLVDADTFGGFPPSHYTPKSEVYAMITEYINAVLDTSY